MESKIKCHQLLARHILQERQRLGGDFVVAFAVESESVNLRDVIKEITGPDTIFIVLDIDAELQAQHLENRKKEPRLIGLFKKKFKYFTLAGLDESNSFNVQITEDMTPNDVARHIISLVDHKWTDNLAPLLVDENFIFLCIYASITVILLVAKTFPFQCVRRCQKDQSN